MMFVVERCTARAIRAAELTLKWAYPGGWGPRALDSPDPIGGCNPYAVIEIGPHQVRPATNLRDQNFEHRSHNVLMSCHAFPPARGWAPSCPNHCTTPPSRSGGGLGRCGEAHEMHDMPTYAEVSATMMEY
eukprot:scaffold82785_cov30-Tisochrysis_lutea.AAC.3